MERLPLEIISHILQFLSTPEDRKAASLVCKIWYEAYQSPVFRNDEVLEVTSSETFSALTELENQNRKFLHVVVRAADITGRSIPFWERFGPYIKTLSIFRCDIREKVFVNVIKCCEQLESLCVQDCRELLMTGRFLEDEINKNLLLQRFSHLKILNLGYNRYLSDAIFVKLTGPCEYLEQLLLPGCHISFHTGLYRKFYSNSGHSIPSESVLTFPVILDFIRDHAGTLRSLSFDETLIDSGGVTHIAEIRNLSLEQLYLRRCQQLTNDSIVKLSCYQPSLTHLDLAYCPRITDPSLHMICSELTQLKSLSIAGCRAITDLGISHLWKLGKLNLLNISECELVRDEGIFQGLCRERNAKLEQLHMSHLAYLSDEAVFRMLEYVPNLKVLDLGYCYDAVTDRSIQCVFSSAKNLRSLILTMCDKVTDRGVTGIASNMMQAELGRIQEKYLRIPLGSKTELTIIRDAILKQDVREICEKASLSSEPSGSSLSNLKHLHTLKLSGCNRITDVSLKYAFRLNELRSLDLSNCQQITSDGLTYISDNNKSIETLNLDNCHNVNDDGVIQIIVKLKRLKTLILGSRNITDVVADWFVKEALNLTYLDVRHCAQLSALAIERIVKGLPYLQTILFCDSKSNDVQYLIPIPPPIRL